MNLPPLIEANGMPVLGPRPFHFMHPENGKGTGFCTQDRIGWAEFIGRRSGKTSPRFEWCELTLWAFDRRQPQRADQFHHIATFYMN